MLNQDFTPKNLMRLCEQKDFIDNDISKNELLGKLGDVCNKISDGTFSFDLKKRKEFYLANDLSNKLILRKLNDNLKRLYKVKQDNRRIIISQIITLLKETCPIWILKTDLSSFYESIDRDSLLDKFNRDTLPSYYTMSLLNELFNTSLIKSTDGLPRGMNISATLSEIYMRKFDKRLKGYDGVYYYARFVDDIILFANDQKTAMYIDKHINEELNILANGLIQNKKKTSLFDGNEIKKVKPMEYLGYSFSTEKIKKKKSKSLKKLEISIARKKVNNIKTRIIQSFLDYIKNKDFNLLQQRIKFLTGNYCVRNNVENNKLKAGIYYNYPYINNYTILNELNVFYQKALFSKNNSFGIKLSRKLSMEQKDILKKYSFRYGFLKKVNHSFSYSDMKKIKACWK